MCLNTGLICHISVFIEKIRTPYGSSNPIINISRNGHKDAPFQSSLLKGLCLSNPRFTSCSNKNELLLNTKRRSLNYHLLNRVFIFFCFSQKVTIIKMIIIGS